MEKKMKISKYVSVTHRMSQQFYDRKLAKYRMGSGQQFFLLEIAAAPGITVQELARKGHYDNGSATRATQKLEAEGYIEIIPDPQDRRIRRMYATDAASDVMRDTFLVKKQWYNILLRGLTEEEIALADNLMERITENAVAFIKAEKEETEWRE